MEDIKFNEKYKSIPKVFLTGLDDDVEKLVAKAFGVCEYLVKPVNTEELTKVIETCICQGVSR